MSFLIFSITSTASADSVATSSDIAKVSTSTESVDQLSTSTENLISEDFSKIFTEKIDVLKKQFGAYILRLGLVNEKISAKAEIFSQEDERVLEIFQIVAESNSALENSKKHLENISQMEELEAQKSESVIAFVYNAKEELGLAKNEIRKAQELGKIAVSKIKLIILE